MSTGTCRIPRRTRLRAECKIVHTMHRSARGRHRCWTLQQRRSWFSPGAASLCRSARGGHICRCLDTRTREVDTDASVGARWRPMQMLGHTRHGIADVHARGTSPSAELIPILRFEKEHEKIKKCALSVRYLKSRTLSADRSSLLGSSPAAIRYYIKNPNHIFGSQQTTLRDRATVCQSRT